MSFRDNMLKKIKINRTAQTVINSFGPPDSGRKVDKSAMRELLKMGSFLQKKERDLELYIKENFKEKGMILVLENDLAIYNTSVEDLVLRRSPTIKEMISIRNAIKILNDSDVIVSKKEVSVQAVEKECLEGLDLNFNESDLKEIMIDGMASLESDYSKGVLEAMSLFTELLGYVDAPTTFKVRHYKIAGALDDKGIHGKTFGPVVIYSMVHGDIKFFDDQIRIKDKEKLSLYKRVVEGKEKASNDGPEVFRMLRDKIVKTIVNQ